MAKIVVAFKPLGLEVEVPDTTPPEEFWTVVQDLMITHLRECKSRGKVSEVFWGFNGSSQELDRIFKSKESNHGN